MSESTVNINGQFAEPKMDLISQHIWCCCVLSFNLRCSQTFINSLFVTIDFARLSSSGCDLGHSVTYCLHFAVYLNTKSLPLTQKISGSAAPPRAGALKLF